MNNHERTGLEVAVIGMACRLPGANNLHEYWENLKNGIESISFFSDEELIEAGVDFELLKANNYVRSRGIIEKADYFDAAFFDYSPRDATLLDPQVRIFHECVYEALEHAGYIPESYNGLIGLYGGDSMNMEGIQKILSTANILEQFQRLLFNETSYLCMLTSYKLNLRGPSLTIQSACSTSLVAIHLACQSLLSGECDLAVAGGVSIYMPQKIGYEYSPEMVHSPDGHCRAFDAKAAGTYFSDGAGVVVLKAYEEALADGDMIHAIIKGTAINNDGSTKAGFTAPSIAGQTMVLKTAYEVAGISPESIGYIEAHGTGTNLGDPMEIEALKRVFDTDKKGFCKIGSVKTNFGHTYTAAGIASFIKTVLALTHKKIPPSLHFEAPNPKIDFENSPFVVNKELCEWENGHFPRRAGVSSFGIGGTNAHIVLEEVPKSQASSPGRTWHMLLLSAKTETALEKQSENLAIYLRENPDINLADVAYTLQVGRAAFPYRRRVICSTRDEALEALSNPRKDRTNGSIRPIKEENLPSVIFMFAGQGSQYVNMGLELYQQERIFQEELDLCFAILGPVAGCDLKAVLYPDASQETDATARLHQTIVAQPLIFSIEYALAKLLMHWGIQAEAMIGYSFGEYVAACLAGVLSLEDALQLIAMRGKLMNRLPAGAMLSVPLSEKEVTPLLNEELSLAIVNGPSCIVAGSEDAIDAFEKRMQQKRYMCMRVPLSVAAHSAEMETIIAEFEHSVKQVTLREPQIPYISSSTGTWITKEQATDPTYWAKHLRETIRFSAGIEQMLAEIPASLFVEIGPGRDLSVLINRFIKDNPQERIFSTLRNPQRDVSDLYFLFNQLGRLWGAGIPIDWNSFYTGESRHRIPLPTYPFERQRYGLEPAERKFAQQSFRQSYGQEIERTELHKNPDITEWFYIPAWKHADISEQEIRTLTDSSEVYTWLVFTDEYGLGHQLINRLKQQNQHVFTVGISTTFTKLNAHSYTIHPAKQEDYETLLGELLKTNHVPTRIIHLWSVTPNSDAQLDDGGVEKAQELGFYSLIFLAQTLGKHHVYEDVRISVVSSHIHGVIGNEPLCPEKATIVSPVKVISQEYPNIHCCNIDIVFPESEDQQTRLVTQLFRELLTSSSEVIITYRDDTRWVQTFKPLRLREPATGHIPQLKKYGVYLITGGLGKIGLTLSQFFAEAVNAKLILIGRSAFPVKVEWENWLATHAANNEISKKIRAIQHIEALGAEVLVASADVSNLAQMQDVMAFAETQFGPINGVVHAAGHVGPETFRTIAELTTTECKHQFQPKTSGTIVLEKVLQTRTLDFCILLSSLSPILGGLGHTAYAAANLFMDAFVCQHNKSNHNRWLSLNWEVWKFSIVNQGDSFGAILSKLAITETEGIKTFQYILSVSGLNQIIVSSGDLQIRLNQWVEKISVQKLKQPKAKLYRRADVGIPYIAPRNEVEQGIVDAFQEVLGFDQISVTEDFFDLGGDSLKAINIVQKIHKKLHKGLQIKDIFDYPSVGALAKHIAEQDKSVSESFYSSISPNPADLYEPFPLTEVQTAYLLGRGTELELGSIATHGYLEFITTLNIQQLNHVLQKAIDYHPMMRAVVMENGQQKILPEVPAYEIEVEDLTNLRPDEQQERLGQERKARSHTVFPAGQWPMFAWKAFKLSETTHWLAINLDMLITDAGGFQIFVNDMMRWYKEPELELPPLHFSFRDYVLAYRELRNSEIYARDKAFWQQKLQDFPNAPALPLRCHPSKIKKPLFKRLQKVLGVEEWTRLKEIAQEHGVSPSALLCTAYATILSYWSNQADLAIDLTVFNRYPFHEDVNRIVGDFTSIMILDIHFTPQEPFWERAKMVQSTILMALEHRHYDGVEFLRDLMRHRRLGNQAIIPFIFTSMLFNESDRADNGVGLIGEPKIAITQTPQVFIDHQAGVLNGQLSLVWDYVEDLFDPKMMEAMFTQYVTLIMDIIKRENNPTLQISPSIQTLLTQYNATFQAIQPTLLHHMFQQQAKAAPQAIALEHGTATMTYEELDKRSNQVAWCLRQKYGVGRHDFIGVLTSRSINTIVYVLGILKAGGAYVPIDPEYPEDRRTYISTNSQCKLLLLPDFYNTEHLSEAPADDVEIINTPEDIAYIIYTSGSTGRPKGVIITHQAVTNTIRDINQRFNVTAEDKILGISSMCFDLSVYDVFGAFSAGATLVLINDQRDIKQLFETLQTHHITIWNSVPAIMEQVVKMAEERTFHTPKEDTAVVDSPGVTVRQTSDLQPQQYWWSPVVHWVRNEHAIHIGEEVYTGVALEVFPELYFLTLPGVTVEAILQKFSYVNAEALQTLLQRLVEKKVLVQSLLPPEEIFASQYRLFTNTYSEEILYVAEASEKFKQQQLMRTYPQYVQEGIPLSQSSSFSEYIEQRYSYRTFGQRPIPFRIFSQLLSIFKQRQKPDGSIRYYYASAGGLYPIDVFIYVKKNRVETLKEGLYYYNSRENSLQLVCDDAKITRDIHYFFNKDIFDQSACSVFFVYNAEATMPKYQGNGYFYACIDTGIMVGILTQVAEHLGIGLCSIGSINFPMIQDRFQLNDNQVLLHTVEIGLKSDLQPATLEHILKESDDTLSLEGKGSASGINTCLRLVMLSGDWIPLTLPEKIKTYFPRTEIISLGGATEASIWSIYYPITSINKRWTSIPYGMPLANQTFYVLNYEMQPCPIGVEGDLYIGGVGLSSGYFNDDEKTRNAFITHRVFGNLYRTGDRGIFHEEGYIEFRGRQDQQVKIRGYRIELGEIECQLLAHPAIAEAVVLVKTNEQTQEKYLCAYYTLKTWETRQQEATPIAELREHLLHTLPEYMIPTHFVRLAQIPLTPNGKIDVKALPAPQRAGSTSTATYIAPTNNSEKIIAELLKELLQAEKVGIKDNFFDLGANSVHIIDLNNKLSEQFGRDIPVSIYFKYPTIEELAQYLSLDDTLAVSDTNQTERISKAKNKFKKVVQKRKRS